LVGLSLSELFPYSQGFVSLDQEEVMSLYFHPSFKANLTMEV
jgi:hypothetical protein